MGPLKCCVGGCDATSETHRLFCFPKNDHTRNLWMSFLVPTNPRLLGLSKQQLLKYRVCEKHFDRHQFDAEGKRLRRSYPCLFTQEEMSHGEPLSGDGKEGKIRDEHSYCKREKDDDDTDDSMLVIGKADESFNEHLYCAQPVPVPECTDRSVHVEAMECRDVIVEQASSSAKNDNELFVAATSTELQTGMKRTRSTKAVKTSAAMTINEVNMPPEADLNERATTLNIVKKVKVRKNKLNSKSRRYINECKNVAANSLGDNAQERLKNARNYAENTLLMENFDKLNKRAKTFLLMQLKLVRKNKMARRFTLEEQLFALAIMKQSPKGYRLLEKMFALPSKRTLARLAEKIQFESGINKNIMEHIKLTIKNWDIKKRLCSLVFDEVALTPHLTFNESKDVIDGFVEIAGERKLKLADHALVLMVRGICSPWRQSIAYHFCEGTVSAPEMEKILKQVIPQLVETGLKPLAIVCDQGSTFRSCIKKLRESTNRLRGDTQDKKNYGTVNISGHDLFVFYDPPHLLKGIRNNFVTKDIVFKNKRATWEDIIYVYDIDSRSGHTRALPKLTADNVDPKKMKKMKVKAAAQVLSARTAAMLHYTHSVHKRLNKNLETMETTADVVSFLDDLFYSVNGSPGGTKGKLRTAVKPNSPHHEFWIQSIKELKKMKFIDTKSKLAREAGKPRYVRVPSLDGWIITLESFLGLSKLLFSKFDVQFFYPRFVNQDPLEIFFGRIRAMNFRNTNPDVNTFKYSFKSLVLSNILSPHSKFSNCEEDDGDTLVDLNYLFTTTTNKENIPSNIQQQPSTSPPENEESFGTMAPLTLIESAISEKIKVQTSAYTAGYICRKLSKKVNCKECAKTYLSKEVEGIHTYIQHREYKRLKNNNLAYPNEKILRLYRENSQLIHNYLNENCYKLGIKKKLKLLIGKCDMSWLGCKSHSISLIDYFKTLIIRVQTHNWCSIMNKILGGKIEHKYVSKMHKTQALALKKYNKFKLRKKVLNK